MPLPVIPENGAQQMQRLEAEKKEEDINKKNERQADEQKEEDKEKQRLEEDRKKEEGVNKEKDAEAARSEEDKAHKDEERNAKTDANGSPYETASIGELLPKSEKSDMDCESPNFGEKARNYKYDYSVNNTDGANTGGTEENNLKKVQFNSDIENLEISINEGRVVMRQNDATRDDNSDDSFLDKPETGSENGGEQKLHDEKLDQREDSPTDYVTGTSTNSSEEEELGLFAPLVAEGALAAMTKEAFESILEELPSEALCRIGVFEKRNVIN
jgi:hypothetical protein